MGPEDKGNNYTLYLDGMPVAIGEIREITPAEDTPVLGDIPLLQSLEFTMQIKTPKRWRCWGRKRFVKLMMSEGITRNYAERLADFVWMLMPYGEAWRNHILNKFWRGLNL